MSLDALVPAETLAYLRAQLPAGFVPETVVVLGSGLAIWPDLQDAVDVPYEAIPHFPRSTVVGHAGTLSFGRIHGHDVVIQRGRFRAVCGSVSSSRLPCRASPTCCSPMNRRRHWT
jgi:purine-nucleoside phosphorylase